MTVPHTPHALPRSGPRRSEAIANLAAVLAFDCEDGYLHELEEGADAEVAARFATERTRALLLHLEHAALSVLAMRREMDDRP